MEELVEEARKGNKEAFSTLILSLEKDLYKIAKMRLRDDEDIYDAVQETILIAFKSIKKLKHVEYFRTWIIKILINQSNYIYRQKTKKKIISFEDTEKDIANEISNIENIDTVLDFNFMCRKLKYEDRIIIILYYMERFTDKEIGQILNLKESTVTTKRNRAKQKIRNVLKLGGE
ncbi:MAG: sigma-70 family RNA polymerase sigma factor [Clostridia bacterium]|nr:sigma-70 family RNA polymerase sigma factor [Clostridia bacterium]